MNTRKYFKAHSMLALCFSLILVLSVAGCSDPDDGGITGTGDPLENYLKSGIAAHNSSYSNCDACIDLPALESDVSADGGDSFSGDFSKTNVQESGVDELDWLKTDGGLIFSYSGGDRVNIFELTEQSGRQAPINSVLLDAQRQYLRGLYLDEGDTQKLIAVADEYSYGYSDYFWHWYDSYSAVQIFDVSDAANEIPQTALITIDGQYVTSRKIGSRLFIVSQYTASIDGYELYPASDASITQNAELIEQTSLNELLPTITIDGQTETLVNSDDCYIPVDPKEATQPTLAIVTEINLDSPSDFSAYCVAAPVSTIYASTQAIYMVQDKYAWQSGGKRSSDIHRITLDNGLNYSGSVALPGNVGWNQQFKLSEREGYLRVVTSDSDIHQFHSVEISSQGLSLAATIPNESQPEPIGKPGEDIYAVRFDGNRAYIVTFRQIDPFYVLDLSNPLLPKVAGELELPGFSTYLHPFGENLVFGIGRDISFNDELGFNTWSVKASLFDVTDPAAPGLISEHVLDGDTSYSPALYNHTALSVLPGDGTLTWRLGFSASIYDSWSWQSDAYYLFELNSDLHPQGASLSLAGVLEGSNRSSSDAANYSYSFYDRGVLAGDYVHYSHKGSLLTELWSNLE